MAAAQSDAGELLPGHSSVHELPPQGSHRYRISLRKDEFLQIRVEPSGVAVRLALWDVGGVQRAQMHDPHLPQRAVVLSFVAAEPGAYRLEASDLGLLSLKADYRITREPTRTAMAADKQRVADERAFVEASTSAHVR